MNKSSAEALLALGGNIGDVRVTFERAIAMLCAETELTNCANFSLPSIIWKQFFRLSKDSAIL